VFVAPNQRYKLKLSKLDFCSLVDNPAQPNAKILMIKGKDGGEQVTATARLAKVSDELGLAFFWAFTSTNPDGTDHFDLHNDAIDTDFIKAAMDWAIDGGAVDEMHDGIPSGARLAFAMPMTPDIAKIYGLVTKQSGLMIAIKPTTEQLAKLKDGTYTGISIGGMGTREIVKSRVAKHSLVTDEVDGHAHTINVYDDGTLYTSYANAADATNGHSHAVTHDASGALVILADSGHTHRLAAGQPSVIVVSPDAVVVVQASAPRTPATKSTRMPAVSQPALTSPGTPPETNMKTAEQLTAEISDLTKRTERLDRIVKLSPDQRAHFDGLTGETADEFLAKSSSDRAAIVKSLADANTVEHTCLDGTVIRKSDGMLALKFAKQADEALKTANIEKAARERTELKKRADALMPHIAGTDDAHADLLGRIEAEADVAKRDAMIATIKAADAAMKSRGSAGGAGGSDPADVSKAANVATFTTKLAEFAKAAGKSPAAAQIDFVRTTEGAELYAAALA